MNIKKYFSCLLCMIVLACTPACYKKQPKETPQEDVTTMLELNDSVFEMEDEEDDIDDAQVVKF